MMKRGWFRESYRHYLAAKGIATGKSNRYFKRIRKSSKSSPGAHQPKKGTKSVLTPPGSRRAERLRKSLTRETEEFLKRGVVAKLPAEEKNEFFNKQRELKRINDEIESKFDVGVLERKQKIRELRRGLKPISQLRSDKAGFTSMLLTENDPEMRKLFEQKIADVEDEIEASAGRREQIAQLRRVDEEARKEVGELRKQKTFLLDRLDELQGIGERKAVNPGFLTEGQKKRGAERFRPREKILPVMTNERRKALERYSELQKEGLRVSPAGAEELVTVSPRGAKTVTQFKRGRQSVEESDVVKGLRAKARVRAAREAQKEVEQLEKEGMTPIKNVNGGE